MSTFLSKPVSRTNKSLSLSAGLMPEDCFAEMLCLERKRTERSGRRFVLMLLELDLAIEETGHIVNEIVDALGNTVRQTDLKGWYKDQSTIGVIFTELGDADGKKITNALMSRVTGALRVNIEDLCGIHITFHMFPDDWERGSGRNGALYPELLEAAEAKRASRVFKRALDLGGSLSLLTLLSPLLVLIAAAVKLTSKGPILFRQRRLGHFGKPFTFLKFRSMYVSTGSEAHQAYVSQFIQGKAETQVDPATGKKMYKLTKDPRVTPLGRFLRKSSLDELPQLINVLLGQMSLVGPRPPIPYEFQQYSPWHKRRLLAVQPGITGLWQVSGRSRTTFDEMVRIDIHYATCWSVWMDLQILFQTPRAVLSGEGAR